jgi:hypothetical protein
MHDDAYKPQGMDKGLAPVSIMCVGINATLIQIVLLSPRENL